MVHSTVILGTWAVKAFKIVACDDTGQPLHVLASGMAYLDALLCLPLMASDFAINAAEGIYYVISIFPDY